MEYVIGILLLVSFVGLAVYAVRGGNLMMGMLIMGIIWTVLPPVSYTHLDVYKRQGENSLHIDRYFNKC